MPYRKKFVFLGATAAILALVYILSLALDPARRNARDEQFTWFPAVARDEADAIEIHRAGGRLDFVLKNGSWFALSGSLKIPVKQGRIDDLFRLLSTRGAFPRRGKGAGSHAGLGLDGSTRLLVKGGAGLPLLDLLVGKEDPSGEGVFLRRNGENEFRSGDRLIGTYVNGEKTAWYNMRFFEEKSPAQVERVAVDFTDYYGIGEEVSEIPYADYAVTRSGENWLLGNAALDKAGTENWIRAILDGQGDNIASAQQNDAAGAFEKAALVRVEMGDGSVLELQIGKAGSDGESNALAVGKTYMFGLAQRSVARILRNGDSFLQQP